MDRTGKDERNTAETGISVTIGLDGEGKHDISTGIGFFDHMLTLFAVHGFFDLFIEAKGDIDIDYHHTVEDVGLVLGNAISRALGDRKGINRFGYAVTPMDDALTEVAVDLSNRPYLVFNVPSLAGKTASFDLSIAKEFFRAFAVKGGMNLHINVKYGENEHHVLESIFKACGRAIHQAVRLDDRISGVRSSKGLL